MGNKIAAASMFPNSEFVQGKHAGTPHVCHQINLFLQVVPPTNSIFDHHSHHLGLSENRL